MACVFVGACVVLVVLAALAVAHREAYGHWPPAAPDRVEWCGRRYYTPTNVSSRGPVGPVRAIGRHPPLVGSQFYAPPGRLSAGACALLIYRKARGRWYAYGLSGGP